MTPTLPEVETKLYNSFLALGLYRSGTAQEFLALRSFNEERVTCFSKEKNTIYFKLT
jgi:hypothetical protein